MKYKGKDYYKMDLVALQLRLDYNFTGYAINVFDLAKNLGAKLVKYSNLTDKQKQALSNNMISLDGFTLINKSNYPWSYTIYFNDYKSEERQRFTIAHEIKHIIFEEESPSEKDEKMANHFARVLLAPSCLVMILMKNNNLMELRKIFQLSTEAMSYAINAAQNRVSHKGDKLNNYEIDFLDAIN